MVHSEPDGCRELRGKGCVRFPRLKRRYRSFVVGELPTLDLQFLPLRGLALLETYGKPAVRRLLVLPSGCVTIIDDVARDEHRTDHSTGAGRCSARVGRVAPLAHFATTYGCVGFRV